MEKGMAACIQMSDTLITLFKAPDSRIPAALPCLCVRMLRCGGGAVAADGRSGQLQARRGERSK